MALKQNTKLLFTEQGQSKRNLAKERSGWLDSMGWGDYNLAFLSPCITRANNVPAKKLVEVFMGRLKSLGSVARALLASWLSRCGHPLVGPLGGAKILSSRRSHL